MSVAIQSEIREGDELNNNQKYAIYTLTITLDGRDAYEISRRFSQFHELMDQLIKDHAAVKEIPFPPRKLLGNLAPKVRLHALCLSLQLVVVRRQLKNGPLSFRNG